MDGNLVVVELVLVEAVVEEAVHIGERRVRICVREGMKGRDGRGREEKEE